MTRRERMLDAIEGRPLEAYTEQHPDVLADDDIGRWLLIEKSRFDGDLWVTTWPDPDAAAEYHDGQEYEDDWIIDVLVDLDTGDRKQPNRATEWSDE